MGFVIKRTIQFDNLDEAREFAQRNNGTLRKGYQTAYAVEFEEDME